MKSFAIQFARPARKELEAIPVKAQGRILQAIEGLRESSRPHGCKKLKGSENTFRIRVGVYRVIYEIHDEMVLVLIVRIRHRKDAYK